MKIKKMINIEEDLVKDLKGINFSEYVSNLIKKDIQRNSENKSKEKSIDDSTKWLLNHLNNQMQNTMNILVSHVENIDDNLIIKPYADSGVFKQSKLIVDSQKKKQKDKMKG